MMPTLDTSVHLAQLMIAFKASDINSYLKALEKLRPYLPSWLYDAYSNMSRNKMFLRKGKIK